MDDKPVLGGGDEQDKALKNITAYKIPHETLSYYVIRLKNFVLVNVSGILKFCQME